MVNLSPHIIFNKLFLLKNITEVYENSIRIKATRGIDRVGIGTFNKMKGSQLHTIYRKCNNGTYTFSPYVEKLKSKGRDKKPRVISVSTIRDRIVLYLLKELLHEVFPGCVFRKLPNNYIKEIIEYYNENKSPKLCYFKTDIKSFYDTIDHDILLSFLGERIKSKKILAIIRRAIKTPTVPVNYRRNEIKKFNRTTGVPQGLAISNILANIYLEKVDTKLNQIGPKYVRYVDDILIFIEKEDSMNIEETISTILDDYNLSLNLSKTECEISSVGFDYLGYNLALPRVSIKERNVENFITSVAAKFSSYIHNADVQLKKYSWLKKSIQKQVFIEDLNEKITGAISESKRYGWLFYFLEINDMTLLHKLDNIVRLLFKRMPDFDHKAPSELKKLTKAYYKAKYDPLSGYIHNYGKYSSIQGKISYLGNRGHLNPEKRYKKEEIELIFNRVRRRRLRDLDHDIGLIS
jgi:retron-type reverse transcriptase